MYSIVLILYVSDLDKACVAKDLDIYVKWLLLKLTEGI